MTENDIIVKKVSPVKALIKTEEGKTPKPVANVLEKAPESPVERL